MTTRPAKAGPRSTPRRLALLFALAAAAATLGACNNNKKGLTAENEELRARLGQVEAALNECESGRGQLLTENEQLRGENDRLRQGAAARTDGTGFDGIAGADVSRGRGEIIVGIQGDVLFDSGQVTLKAGAKRTLDEVASVIKARYSGNEIKVAGYTDSDPIRKSKWGTNERLSAERAMAVEEYLASRGMSKDRMYIAGYGPAKGKGTKAQSRRVEIIIVE